MTFATATFAGTLGAELSTQDTNWSKQSGFANNALIGVDGAYFLAHLGGTYACYQHVAVPPGADYSVQAEVKRLTTGTGSPEMGVCGRMQSGVATFYASLHLHALNQTRLYKFVGGAITQLGSSYSNTLTAGLAQVHELRMTGSTIAVYVDGVQRISATDTAITTAGKSGIMGLDMRQAGVNDNASIDNWSAAASDALTMTGPTSGQVSVASTNFTLAFSGTVSGSHVVTPNDGAAGGTFTPTTVTLTSGTPTGTFTYTPTTAGARTISATDAGGYTAPTPITYTSTATSGTLTSSALKNNTGTLLASLAAEAFVHSVTSGALVVKKTGLSSSAVGVISFGDSTLAAATAYRVVWRLTVSGAEGIETLTAT